MPEGRHCQQMLMCTGQGARGAACGGRKAVMQSAVFPSHTRTVPSLEPVITCACAAAPSPARPLMADTLRVCKSGSMPNPINQQKSCRLIAAPHAPQARTQLARPLMVCPGHAAPKGARTQSLSLLFHAPGRGQRRAWLPSGEYAASFT